MRSTLQLLTLWVAAAAVVVFGAGAVAAYRPGGATASKLAVQSLKRALTVLGNEADDSDDRLAEYRDELAAAERLLRRALRSTPTDTASIERLAMARWELGVLAGSPEAETVSSMMALAASRAPRVPEIQADLGALIYRMGRPDEAASFMKRAVELSPGVTGPVVTKMLDADVAPGTILRTLPQTVDLVLALRDPFARSGDWSEWLACAERLLAEHPRELLVAYADACLASIEPDRLLSRMQHLGVFDDKAAEAERQIAMGRAYLDRKDMVSAANAAAAAYALSPDDPRLLELVGQVAFLAGDSAKAEQAFRDALGAQATSDTHEGPRARLYRERGQALEQLGRLDEAFDEYRRALELTPDDPWLRRRFAATSSRQGSEPVK